MKVSAEQLENVKANIGRVGFPGGCAACMFDKHHGPVIGHDVIICIMCGEAGKPAHHNHVVCIACGG